MPFRKIVIPPGINRESTRQSSGASWYDGNNIRWRDRFAQTIGGWDRNETYTLQGIGRKMHAWTDFSGHQFQCVGTSFKYYIIAGTSKFDITPVRKTTTGLAGPIQTLDITSGLIQVTDTAHGVQINDFVVFDAVQNACEGIAASEFTSVLEGFQVESVIDANKFTLTITGATAGVLNPNLGGDVDIHYKISSGTSATVFGTGWGAGTWGGDDYLPTSHTIGAGLVLTTNSSSVIRIDTDAAFTFETGGVDYIYPIGLAGTAGSFDTTYLNNKWWLVNTLDTDDAVIDVGYTITTGGTGGTSGTFYVYDQSAGTVVGASRGWGDSSALDTVVASMRTLSIDNFGEDLMFSNKGGPIYYYDTSANSTGGVPTSSKYAVLLSAIADAGSATPEIVDSFIVSRSHGHTIAFGCNDVGSSNPNPMLVRWSDRHNPFSWLPSASNEAGGEVLREGSRILGGVPTKDEIVVFTNSGIYSMRYVGFPEVYGVNLVTAGVSGFSSSSAVAVVNSVYFLGNEGFYVYNGSVVPLPNHMSSYVFDTINKDQREKVFAGINSAFTEIIWIYPDGDSFEPNRYVTYNYGTGTFGMGTFDMVSLSQSSGSSSSYDRTSWQDSGVFEFPMSTYVLDFDPTTTPTTELTAVMRHEFGTSAQGVGVDYRIQSSEVDIDEGGRYAFYDKIIPDVELFDVGPNVDGKMTVSVQGRKLPGRAEGSAASVSVDFSSNSVSGLDYTPDFNETSVRGRDRSISIKFSSDTPGFGWRLGNTRIRFRRDGRD